MAASAEVPSKTSSVAEIFDSMTYGLAPEADNVVNAWITDHNGAFGHFINNTWHQPEERKTYNVKNPATGEVIATTMRGESEDVDLAVGAARKAYQGWSGLSPHARARYMYSITRHVQKHARLISVLESMDNGKTIRETRDCDIPIVIRHLYHYAGWAQLMDTEMRGWKSVGVVGGIVPWNFPLMLLMWKVCPALAMGNTVVLKPASFTSLSALLFAEICAEAGLPAGVFNVVTGSGAFGSQLATHPDVDKVAFTGSTGVGQILRRLTAGSGKKLSLELGGKSPVVVFESCDMDSAVEGVVDAIWFNQGQVCSAGSKLLVQQPIYEKFIKKLKERLTHFRVGSSLDKANDMGAIVDESQLRTIKEYVDSAREEGAQVYQATACVPASGCFYPPTLITDVQTVSKVVQEEIFGPVLVALPFRTAKEGVALANNTNYGLAGSVWTQDVSLALEVALLIKAGTVWVNAHNVFDAAAGFGGYKESGYGRDGGKEGLYEYVKPSWEARARPNTEGFDLKTFGSFTQSRPTITGATPQEVSVNGQPAPVIDHTYKFFYGGAQKRPDAPYSRPIMAADGVTVLSHVGEGNRKDVRNAVQAAHAAAPGWGKRAAHNRAQIVYYMAENLEMRREEFALQISRMTGKSKADAMKEVELSIERLFYWGAYCDKYGGTVQETTLYGCTVKIHEPVGVLGVACPDDWPLLGFVSLLAPAVVRSNCVVIIPSEKYPLCALDLYQVFETSDLPAGVVNILTGDRDHITKYLAEHRDIQSMWYFGSADGSRFVEHTSADNVKRTWVNYGVARDWSSTEQGQGEEFLYQSVQCKNVWIPMGDIFAN